MLYQAFSVIIPKEVGCVTLEKEVTAIKAHHPVHVKESPVKGSLLRFDPGDQVLYAGPVWGGSYQLWSNQGQQSVVHV